MGYYLPSKGECQRRRGDKCLALKRMICKEGPCWAYTDDPDWLKKVKQAVRDYSGGYHRRGEKSECAD
jgi:hypothetical protein